MKKILTTVVVCAAMSLATSAHAIDSTGGCGLGFRCDIWYFRL